MGYKNLSVWKKNAIILITMLILLYIAEFSKNILRLRIFNDNGGSWIYSAIIFIALLIILITYFRDKLKLNFSKVKILMMDYKITSFLLIMALLLTVLNFISDNTFVHKIPLGQGYPMEGQTLYGCKSCSGFPFFSSFSCSTNITNCFSEFIIPFMVYSLIALFFGFLFDWIIKKIKTRKI
jgi:hypothetical protein